MSNHPSDDELLDAAIEKLPSEIDPERDLWPDITRRIRVEAPVDGPAPTTLRWWQRLRLPVLVPAFVAAAVVAFVLLPEDAPSPSTSPAPATAMGTASTGVALGAADSGAPDLEAALAAYKVASHDLMAAFAAQKRQLDPETRAVFEDHLAQIDRALDELDTARTKNPDDASLVGFVLDVQQQRVALLVRALDLSQPS